MVPFEPLTACEWQVECSTIKQRSVHLFHSRQWTNCRFRFDSEESSSGGNFLDAHTLVLAMASPVFAAMFYGDAGSKESPVIIVDIDKSTFESMLEYIYTEEIYISNIESAMNLCLAANKYILPHLEMFCVIYLVNNLNPDNVCQLYEFANFCSDETLKNSCVQMIRMRTLEVLKGESFKEIQLSTLKEIVAMDPLNIESELDLINAVFEYFKDQDHTDLELDNIGRKYKLSNKQKKILCKTCEISDKKVKEYDFTINQNNNVQRLEGKRVSLRQKMDGLVENIRFLRLSSKQLAKCKKLQSILSKQELFELSMKIASPLPQMPVPVGFSTSVLSRNDRSQKFIRTRFVLKGVSRFVPIGTFKGDYLSAQDIPFQVVIRLNKSRIDAKNEKCLVIFLSCKRDCEVYFKTRLVSHKPSIEANQQMALEKTVIYSRCQREHVMKYSLRKIRDPEVGVLVDDCVILDVHIVPTAIYARPEENTTQTDLTYSGHLQKMREYLNNISARR